MKVKQQLRSRGGIFGEQIRHPFDAYRTVPRRWRDQQIALTAAWNQLFRLLRMTRGLASIYDGG